MKVIWFLLGLGALWYATHNLPARPTVHNYPVQAIDTLTAW